MDPTTGLSLNMMHNSHRGGFVTSQQQDSKGAVVSVTSPQATLSILGHTLIPFNGVSPHNASSSALTAFPLSGNGGPANIAGFPAGQLQQGSGASMQMTHAGSGGMSSSAPGGQQQQQQQQQHKQQQGAAAPSSPQALMNALNLLQQNIGALQALVPLIAQSSQQGATGVQDQQLQLQQQQAAASAGVASVISQLAAAAAGILPQVGAQDSLSLFSQQQQSQLQQNKQQSQNVEQQQHQQLQQQPQPQPQQQLKSISHIFVSQHAQSPSVHNLQQSFGDLPLSQFVGSAASSGANPFPPGAQSVLPMHQNNMGTSVEEASGREVDDGYIETLPEGAYDIVEIDPVEILAEHTHFCEICGKGFKRDANLRMHMRGHGDEYKSPSALSKPDKHVQEFASSRPKRFSCPWVGCKRNKKHRKFQTLKTMLCVKNHYRRSHCPKILTCSKCGSKKFSVVADLKTHEKHCGRETWMCSCRTTFSRKDKLLGHLSLFAGHSPAMPLHLMEEGINSSCRTSPGNSTQLFSLDGSPTDQQRSTFGQTTNPGSSHTGNLLSGSSLLHGLYTNFIDVNPGGSLR